MAGTILKTDPKHPEFGKAKQAADKPAEKPAVKPEEKQPETKK